MILTGGAVAAAGKRKSCSMRSAPSPAFSYGSRSDHGLGHQPRPLELEKIAPDSDVGPANAALPLACSIIGIVSGWAARKDTDPACMEPTPAPPVK